MEAESWDWIRLGEVETMPMEAGHRRWMDRPLKDFKGKCPDVVLAGLEGA